MLSVKPGVYMKVRENGPNFIKHSIKRAFANQILLSDVFSTIMGKVQLSKWSPNLGQEGPVCFYNGFAYVKIV